MAMRRGDVKKFISESLARSKQREQLRDIESAKTGASDAQGHLLADIDRAHSAFALIFYFHLDSSFDDQQDSFSELLLDAFHGSILPLEVKSKLRIVYDSLRSSPRELRELLDDVVRDFSEHPDLLLCILRLALRVSNDEGLLSRRHVADLKELISRFNIPVDYYESCDEFESYLLSTIVQDSDSASRSGASNYGSIATALVQHYQRLGCLADASDNEIRKAYRRLAKKLHPDTAPKQQTAGDQIKRDQVNSEQAIGDRASSDQASRVQANLDSQFKLLQHSYEAISRSRGWKAGS